MDTCYNDSEKFLKDFFERNSELPKDGSIYSIVTSYEKPLFAVKTERKNGMETYIPCIMLTSDEHQKFYCPMEYFMTSKHIDVNDDIVICEGPIGSKPTVQEIVEFFTSHRHNKFRCEPKSFIVGDHSHRWVKDIYKLNLIE